MRGVQDHTPRLQRQVVLIVREDPHRQVGNGAPEGHVRCAAQAHRTEPSGQAMARVP